MNNLPAKTPASDPVTVPSLSESVALDWYTPQELCDSCPSQSYFMVVFESGNLFFCRHHYSKNEALIFEWALDVVDESELFRP